jgi:hypothetical protein
MTISSTFSPGALATRLVEASFADLITAVEGGAELSEQCRRHWTCSLRQIAKWLGRPLEVVPARWQAIRLSIGQLHHARVGVTFKTLANHRSNVRAALRWYSKEEGVPRYGTRLSPEWERIRDTLDERLRERLYSLMRYCSARCIRPPLLDDAIFDDYWRYRAENTGRATNNTARRFMVRAWNAYAATTDGMTLQRLSEPPIKTAEPAWEKFPVGLRHDIDTYLGGFAKVHRTLTGKRIQPCSPTTITYRRAEMVAVARMAVTGQQTSHGREERRPVLPRPRAPTFLPTASDDHHDGDVQSIETDETHGAVSFCDDRPSPRWRITMLAAC